MKNQVRSPPIKIPICKGIFSFFNISPTKLIGINVKLNACAKNIIM